LSPRRLFAPALLALAAAIGSGWTSLAAAQPAGSLDEAAALHEAGLAADRSGDYVRAERAFLRAQEIFARGLGAQHPQVGVVQGSLCNVYEHMGDYARAEPHCEAAVDIADRAYGPRDVRVAVIVSNYALVSERLGRITQAELLYSRALDIYGGAGPTTREIPNALNNLGSLYLHTRDYARAEPLLLKSAKAAERILGADDPDTANAFNSLGVLYGDMGKLDQAEASLLRAIGILEKRLGADHPHLAPSYLNLGALYLRMGAIPRAIAAHARGADIEEKSLALVLAGGSEQQKRTFMATMRSGTDGIVSVHAVAAPNDPSAARLALLTILRRKGRVLDALAQGNAALRGRLGEADRAELDQLGSKRSALAALVLGKAGGSPEQRAQQAALEAEVQRLEASLSARSAEYRVTTAPVTIESVAAAIPDGAALVEIVAYRPVDFKAESRGFQAPRYRAYVLDHRGDVRSVDLGAATAIDGSVTALRKALAAKSAGAEAAARDLDGRVMQPVRGLLGGVEMVFLSPDGSLNLIPFAALVDESSHFLVERFAFDYVTSGRDLLRQSAHSASQSGALIVANPDFGPAPANRPAGGGLAGAMFKPLPGTADEARSLGALLSGSRVLTGGDATATALAQAHAPRILHVATHGFFLPDTPPEPAPKPITRSAAPAEDQRSFDLEERARIENPLLRSGLVLAGANLHGGGGKDTGILTALEATGLDLFGTKLVVLSACETGLGDVLNGDGVYGLRRALVIAGAETQVMSLWKVDDAATRDLMIAYYKALEGGGERGAAMRGVQRAMLGSKATAHPFYWASFIVSGDPSSLDGKLATPAPRPASGGPGPVDPGPRGCSCEAAGSAGGPRPWMIFLASLGLLAGAARRTSRNRSVIES
jgi:MYXO-CTERM domain-containing protein